MTSGRKFAEHTGLEDAERIDNDPLYSISAERIIRLLYRNPSIMALLCRTFFPYDLDSRRVNNLSHAPLLDLSV